MSVDTPILKQAGAGTPDAELIKDTTTKDFMRDVVEASREVPVLVDFWAPWCGPCRQLTPILEKAVRAAKGAVKLVKLNIDEHPQIPGQMGVQSIPAVFAFQDGRPVDGFMGALPESRVNAFIARLIGDTSADDAAELEAAEAALAAGDRQHRRAGLRRNPARGPRERASRSQASPSATSRPATSPAPSRHWRWCRPAKAESAPVASARAALELQRKAAKRRRHRQAPRQARGRSQGRSGALRPRAGAQRQGRPRRARSTSCSRSSPRTAPGTTTPRASSCCNCSMPGARAIPPLSRAGKGSPRCSSREAKETSRGGHRPLSQRRRHAEGAAGVSAARRHSPAARLAHAQRVRAALPRSRRSCAGRRPADRRRAAGARSGRTASRRRARAFPCGGWAAPGGSPPSPRATTAA